MIPLLILNIYDMEAARNGAATLVLYAIAIGVAVLLCDKLFAGKKWW